MEKLLNQVFSDKWESQYLGPPIVESIETSSSEQEDEKQDKIMPDRSWH